MIAAGRRSNTARTASAICSAVTPRSVPNVSTMIEIGCATPMA